jgi:glucose-6-phosphate 1-epimerase
VFAKAKPGWAERGGAALWVKAFPGTNRNPSNRDRFFFLGPPGSPLTISLMSQPDSLPAPLPGVTEFHRGSDGLTRLRIKTALAEAEIVLQGAHVTHFQPAGAAPVLFMSGSSYFMPGKPLRGGIPVCFPWFSARAGHPESPAHGFARTLPWSVESLNGSAESEVTAVLRLDANESTRAHWPHEFTARLRVVVGRELTVTLEVENRDAAPLEFEEALHTYFSVADVHDVSVTGLEGAAYLDKMDGLQRKKLGQEPLRFTAETDRIFQATTATCIITDPGLQRKVVVEKSGSHSTIVWNPWTAKSAAMPDFGDDEWPGMLCIETANCGSDTITLAPGTTHAMAAVIRLA